MLGVVVHAFILELERQKQENQGIPGRLYSENTVLTRKVKKKLKRTKKGEHKKENLVFQMLC